MATICLLGNSIATLLRFRKELVALWVSQRHRVAVCAPDIDQASRRQIQAMGAVAHSFFLQRGSCNPFFEFKTLVSLRRLLKTIQPTHLLSCNIKPVLYGSLTAKWAGVPHIFSLITGLGYAFRSNRSWLKKMLLFLYRHGLQYNEVVFFQNDDDLAVFRGKKLLKSGQKAVCIPGSGVNLHDFFPAAFPASPRFLFLGRLLKDKGIEEYVEAAKKVRQRHPEIICYVAGWIDRDNPMAISPQQLACWQEKGAVAYLGRIDDVQLLFGKISVYVHPSHHEGTSRAVLEAMAMGRPIITTDAPGCRQTIEEGVNGILVPIQSPDRLASAMEHFIAHPDQIQRMGQASRRRAESHYNVHDVNRKMTQSMGLSGF